MSYTFDCTIDTHELASSVDSMKHHVDATTGAVVAMKAAVVKAEEDGAKNVCQKVNQGFYSLIHSQISQKMAAVQSKVDSRLMRLSQQAKQLRAIRSRMERDYHMISARYSKLFGTLNKNLQLRVTELDRPIIDFAVADAERIANRPSQLVAAVPVGQVECVRSSQRIAVSSLKNRTVSAIDSIRKFIDSSNTMQEVIDRRLLKRDIDSQERTIMIPVAVMESTFDKSGISTTSTYMSEMVFSNAGRNDIISTLSDNIRSEKIVWKDKDAVPQQIEAQFRQMVAESGIDKTRRETMIRLFENHKFQTF